MCRLQPWLSCCVRPHDAHPHALVTTVCFCLSYVRVAQQYAVTSGGWQGTAEPSTTELTIGDLEPSPTLTALDPAILRAAHVQGKTSRGAQEQSVEPSADDSYTIHEISEEDSKDGEAASSEDALEQAPMLSPGRSYGRRAWLGGGTRRV